VINRRTAFKNEEAAMKGSMNFSMGNAQQVICIHAAVSYGFI
jgi:hypothetical protein